MRKAFSDVILSSILHSQQVFIVDINEGLPNADGFNTMQKQASCFLPLLLCQSNCCMELNGPQRNLLTLYTLLIQVSFIVNLFCFLYHFHKTFVCIPRDTSFPLLKEILVQLPVPTLTSKHRGAFI